MEKAPQPQNALLDAALAYAAKGWRVLPIRLVPEEGGKINKPPCFVEHGYKDASSDPAQLHEWFADRNDPQLGLGIAIASGKLLIWDCDTTEAVDKWGAEAQVATVSGGRHLYCQRPESISENRWTRAMDGVDILTDGYIVVPPTAGYTFLGNTTISTLDPPVLGESAVRKLREVLGSRTPTAAAGSGVNPLGSIAEHVREGGRNDELISYAGSLRNLGLNAEALFELLRDHTRARHDPPLGEREVWNVAKSAATMEIHPPTGLTVAKSSSDTFTVAPGTSVGHYKPPEWLLEGFIPLGVFVQLYGPGGVGKSSIAGWLLANFTKRGRRVIFATVEEPPELMHDRIEVCGGDRSRAFHVEQPLRLKFPSLAQTLFARAKEVGADFIYVDSLLSHLDSELSSYATDDMRRAFDPVSDLCVREGRTLLACYHVTKGGTAQSSNVLRDQARVVMRAHAFEPGHVEVAVHKTNFKRPEEGLRFQIKGVCLTDDEIPVAFEAGRTSRTADDMLADHISISAGQKRPDKMDAVMDRAAQIKDLLITDPTLTGKEVYAAVGGNYKTTFKLIGEIRRSLVL